MAGLRDREGCRLTSRTSSRRLRAALARLRRIVSVHPVPLCAKPWLARPQHSLTDECVDVDGRRAEEDGGGDALVVVGDGCGRDAFGWRKRWT